MSDRAQQQQEQQPQGGGGSGNIPPGMEALVFGQWTTTNTNGSRPAIKDPELYYTDGFMPVGDGRLRTMPDVGPALVNAFPNQIVFYDFFNIGTTPYCVFVTSDGSVWVFVTNSNPVTVTLISGPGTITSLSPSSIGISQWGSQFLIVVSSQTNGYFLWDGTTFYRPGDAVPGFTTVPTGVSGTAVEIYQQHVWVANGATITFSAPQSITDFSTGSGGGSFTSNDSFLRVGYTELKSTNGFLYLIGDSSINYISGVATGGGPPPVTTFTNQNADPEVGTPWPGTVDVLSSAIVMANPWGAHVSYGGRVNKISEPMDGVYNTVPNFGGFTPSACKAIVYGKRVWCLLLPVVSTITGQISNTILIWSPVSNRWFLTHQSVNLVYIQHEEINSFITGYGTDGHSIYRLFQQPSVSFQKSFQTKLRWAREGYLVTQATNRIWGLMEIFSTLDASLNISVDNEITSASQTTTLVGAVATWTNNADAIVTWFSGASVVTWFVVGNTAVAVLSPSSIAQQGVLLGLTVTTMAADISVISLALGADVWGYRG